MIAVSFKVSKKERKLIAKIVARAASMSRITDRLCLEMDITACHANGTRLDLARLFSAPDFDFMHDVLGIHRNIDRKTGKLANHFLPRFAKSESEVAA